MTNIGSRNMIHRLRRTLARAGSLKPHLGRLHGALDAAEQEAKAGVAIECLVEACAERPIESHVIPDAFLKSVAGSGRPIAPHLEGGEKAGFAPLSARTTPVFSGYCSTHDTGLFPWETKKDLSAPLVAESQLMRVADAMWFEFRLRARILDRAAAAISQEATEAWGVSIGTEARSALEMWHDSWRASSEELRRSVDDMDGLRLSLRRNLEMVEDGEPRAVVGSVSIPAVPRVPLQIADGGWIPDWHPIDGASRRPAPFVISVLRNEHGARLMVASTPAAATVVQRMEAEFATDARAATAYAMHWMRHGNFSWYLDPEAWDLVDDQTRARLAVELERSPFVAAAMHGGSRLESHPILRWGNGWS